MVAPTTDVAMILMTAADSMLVPMMDGDSKAEGSKAATMTVVFAVEIPEAMKAAVPVADDVN
jgi:hypothetical protein